jgi:dipeptidyl aminopeptidase/acylaminoacyl peptidase
MTSPRRFEHDLPVLLDDLYFAGTPDYRDDLVQQIARMRQRPAWTFPGRWFPMDLVTTRVPTTQLPWRQLTVLAVLAALLAATLAFYFGSQQQRLPTPFGPAANGVVAYSHEGDIYVADPLTGNATAISSGPDADLRPIFSPDGTKVVFERTVQGGGGQSHLFVAAADGAGLRRVTTQPLLLTPKGVGDPYQFSPDGLSLIVAARRADEGPAIFVMATDGNSERRLDLGALADRVTSPTEATFRPSDGNEILFGATDLTNGSPGLYAVSLAGGADRTIVPADPSRALDLGTWSPDGQLISYSTWDTTANGLTVRTHLVRPDGTGDRVLPMPAEAVWDLGAAWSNDGTRLHVVRGYTSGWEDSRPVIVPVDGSDTGVEIAYEGPIQGNCCYSWEWSPDDTMIIGKPIDAAGQPSQQVIIDVATRTIRPAPWTSTGDPVIQRRAP